MSKVAIQTNEALSSNANPSVPGRTVTCTATVAAASGAGTAAGTVIFKNGSTMVNTATLNVSGVATFTTSALSEGNQSIPATHGGSSILNTSVSDAPLQSIAGTFAATTAASAGSGSLTQTVIL